MRPPTRLAGFTLVELMVTVLIASVLLSIAVPTYTSQIRKSRRTDAKTALLDLAGREERYYNSNNGTYSSTATDLGYSGPFPIAISNSGGVSYYTVSATVTAGSATILATYTLTAAATGDQAKDTQCSTFKVISAGAQTSATSAAVDSSTTCWR
jgi:type IV pilus assembly protein PilE